MSSRSPLLDRIEIVPGKRSGKACIIGTRITVYDVLACLAAGMTTAEVLADYPDLCEDDVRACLAALAARLQEGRPVLDSRDVDEEQAALEALIEASFEASARGDSRPARDLLAELQARSIR